MFSFKFDPARVGEIESVSRLYPTPFFIARVWVSLHSILEPDREIVFVMGPARVVESKMMSGVAIDMPEDGGRHGHGRLAAFMGVFPEAAIFHRFAALNVKNILYLQAELLWLEDELKRVAEEDAQSSREEHREFARNWFLLRYSGDDSGGDSRQWKLFIKIRKVLDQYNTAILQQKEIVKMEPPGRLALSLLKEWMESPTKGNVYLRGDDSKLWTSTNPPDLLALIGGEPEDLLSLWMTKAIRKWLHPAFTKIFNTGQSSRNNDSTQFLERTIITHKATLRTTSVIALALSSILPFGSILVLNIVNTVAARLGIVASFTVVFSLCLGIVTRARRVEIFAAAAAYAAVQVVFIAGDGARDVPGQ